MANGASVIEFPPPAASSPVTSPVPTPPVSRLSRLSRWRLAARLARREVRRRPGRTILVMLLIAVPVIGMTIGDVANRTRRQTWTEQFRQNFGQSDLNVDLNESPVAGGRTAGVLLTALPPGSRVVSYRNIWLELKSPDPTIKRQYTELTDLPLEDPLTNGIVEILDGVAPTTTAQVLLSPSLAKHFKVTVGDTLVLARPEMTLEVTGIGRKSQGHRGAFMALGDVAWPADSPSRGFGGLRVTLVDLPAGVSQSDTLVALNRDGWSVQMAERDIYGSDSYRKADLAWGWVVGALVLTVLGIIVAAAFATSARRQLVTIGQLSSNGANHHLVRSTLALQGFWSGLIGSVAGVGLALLFLTTAGRGLIDYMANRDAGPLSISIIDLLVIIATGTLAATVAAYVPARSAAKVPVMAALAGRRPLGVVPRRLAPIGLVLFGGGLGLLALSTVAARGTSDGGGSDAPYVFASILGGLGVLFGACCISPFVVDLLGPIGERIGGTGRLAARSMARLRTRSAAVVTAITAAGAVAIGASTALISIGARDQQVNYQQTARNEVALSSYEVSIDSETVAPIDAPEVTTIDIERPRFVDVPASAPAQVDAVLPGLTWSPRLVAVYDPAPGPLGDNFSPATGPGFPAIWTDEGGVLTIVDERVRAAMHLSDRDTKSLDSYGVLAPPMAPSEPDGTLTVVLERQGGPVEFPAARIQDRVATLPGYGGLLITPTKARELGLEVVASGLIGSAPADFTAAQRDQLQGLATEFGADGPYADPFVQAPTAPQTGVSLDFQYVNNEVPKTLVQSLIIGFALLMTLLVVAIGLALSAAESRDERDVLMAIGAKPGAMTKVAGLKALLIAFAGCLLAIPTGFLPVATVLTSDEASIDEVFRRNDVTFPWMAGLLLVVAVPLIAGLVAWVGSGVAQRVRPPRMSTLVAD